MSDLEGFASWLYGKQRAKGTIEDYCYELKKFPKNFKKQQAFARENKNKRMLLSAWRSYLKYLKHKKVIGGDELFDLLDTHALPPSRGNTYTKKSGRAFPYEQWGEIIRCAPNRTAKIGIWIGFYFGLRLSEITYLRCQDVDLDQMIVRVTGKNRDDEWTPKHFRERVVPISTEDQVSIFKKWIRERPKELIHPYFLWVERTGLQVSGRTFQRWCKNAHPELKPHDLRRSYATNLYYASGKDIKVVQLALGHSDVAVTSNYLRLEESEYLAKIRTALSKNLA